MLTPDEITNTAERLWQAQRDRQSVPPLTGATPAPDEAEAYRILHAITRLRQAGGETPVGIKIGFTNRTIWPEYDVYRPIWGPVYDSTLRWASEDQTVAAADFVEPRIEPEIVFGLASIPRPGMSPAERLGCIAWVAHGFEIVQSLYPDWRFKVEDCVAAFGLHGCLTVGPKVPLATQPPERWLEQLETFAIRLFRNGELVDTGKAANVLDGPLHALGHLVEVLAADPEATPLPPGAIITTGTLTRAFPVAAGEVWTTELDGLPVSPMRLFIL